MKKIVIVLWLSVVLSVLVIIPGFTSYAQSFAAKTPLTVGPLQQINEYYSTQTTTYSDGTSLTRHIISGPPKSPHGFEVAMQAVSLPKPDKAMATGSLTIPAFNWVFGCSSVSGAMIAGYYDRNGYPNMYTGPTNGGVMPLDNSSWPTWSDGLVTYPNLPLAASHNGVDGRDTRGTIDDYWIQYNNAASDPYITGSWAQHTWSDGQAIGDYMKTSQSAYYNTDGSSSFWNYSSASQLTCTAMESLTSPDIGGNYISWQDATYGRKLFYEARGYTITTCYNQPTDNKYAGGFSFVQYKAEIDAGRPVMLNLAGHTIVGVGYNDPSTVYVHDTWDYLNHSMTWGGSYSGMELLSVSIVNLATPASGDIGIIMTDSPDPVTLGSNITYTITTTNSADVGTTATMVTDTLPAGVIYVSATPSQGSCTGTSTVSCNLGAISSGAHATITLIVTSTATNAALANTATVTSNLTDSNPANDSATATTVVNNPVPAISSLSPTSATSGGSAFTLTVNGSNFVSSSQVQWNGADRITTFVSFTQLTAAITASDIATAGTAAVTVFNPIPVGGTSSTSTFTISAPAPATVSAPAPAGGGGGGCFIATAAFGSPLAGQVEILRQFRDRYLLTNAPGQQFVSWYYRNGPVAARYIEDKPSAKAAVRLTLYPLIAVSLLLISGYLPLVMIGLLLCALLFFRFRTKKLVMV